MRCWRATSSRIRFWSSAMSTTVSPQRSSRRRIAGVTMLNGMGWYTKESSQVVMVICRKRETADILKIVRNLDPKAFVSVASVTGVYGQGFGIIDGGMLNGMKKN